VTAPDARDELRDGYHGTFPPTVHGALRDLADWLDAADQLINLLADLHGKERPSNGDDVQQDMRCLADWFAAHPAVGANAWTYVRKARAAALAADDQPDGAR
jgi:hypothetical protein